MPTCSYVFLFCQKGNQDTPAQEEKKKGKQKTMPKHSKALNPGPTAAKNCPMTASCAGVDTGGKEAVFRRTELLALST